MRVPLMLEIRDPRRETWQILGRVPVGEDGSLSHNPQAGQREIYRFRHFGDHSLIEKSSGGVDSEHGLLRAISTFGFEEVARLDAENPTLEMWLRTDRMREAARFRWRHT